ncbi:MAG: hypothetical protein HQ518_23460 [Rhodopirellula sp.]|nr:hypothetical protein [Rhodopirellula sp.]
MTDNGAGMTAEVIKNYFTQIDKSYYRSPEFNQERTAMKAVGRSHLADLEADRHALSFGIAGIVNFRRER